MFLGFRELKVADTLRLKMLIMGDESHNIGAYHLSEVSGCSVLWIMPGKRYWLGFFRETK